MAGDGLDPPLKTITFDELKLDINDTEVHRLQLCYRGEGNDNLVLQAPKIRYVLRFHKSESVVDEQQENEKLKTSFAYYYLLVKPIFSMYCSVPIIAKVSEAEVRKLDCALFSVRPNHRKEKRIFYTGVEVHPDYTFLPLYSEYEKQEKPIALKNAPISNRLKNLLSQDYLTYRNFVFTLLNDINFPAKITNELDSRANTLCVEIKPKQAWSAAPDRRAMCVYCMNQFFKLSSNKIKSRSAYCPLDLFSGNRTRMKKALLALMQEPQNNFRIFKNGELVYGENVPAKVDHILKDWLKYDSDSLVDIFCHLLEEALLLKLASNTDSVQLSCQPYVKSRHRDLCPHLNMELLEQNLTRESRCSREISLPKNSVLERILQLQQLDENGIEVAYDYYETHKSEFTSELGYVDQLIANSQIANGQIELPALNVVEAYLFSSAAKDLSILIALEPLTNSHTNLEASIVTDPGNRSYKVNISVVDVGPKPISCVKKHWKRDADVLTVCARHLCPVSTFNL